MFRKVAACCRRLKFAVLIDCHAFKGDRAGQVRNVAQMVSTFVRNFEEHNMAFFFIFTKTDALGKADSRAKALSLLDDELEETLRDTSDSDGNVNSVLEHMLDSLQDQMPNVDIYHPALSDVKELRKALESFDYEVVYDLTVESTVRESLHLATVPSAPYLPHFCWPRGGRPP